jgi:hypothetical protein
MLPLMPGVALIAASLLGRAEIRPGDARLLAVLFAVLFLVLTLGPSIALWVGRDTPNGFVRQGLGAFHPLLSLAAGALALLLLFRARSIRTQALAMAASSALLLATVAIQCNRGLFKLYDLAPLASALAPYEHGPIAVFNQYAGEIGFMARLTHPVQTKHREELKAWLDEHPDGTGILRDDTGEKPEAGTVVHAQPFRPNKTISVLRAKSN